MMEGFQGKEGTVTCAHGPSLKQPEGAYLQRLWSCAALYVTVVCSMTDFDESGQLIKKR
jgi:hypothetical protein